MAALRSWGESDAGRITGPRRGYDRRGGSAQVPRGLVPELSFSDAVRRALSSGGVLAATIGDTTSAPFFTITGRTPGPPTRPIPTSSLH
jgi:hypothetical protein